MFNVYVWNSSIFLNYDSIFSNTQRAILKRREIVKSYMFSCFPFQYILSEFNFTLPFHLNFVFLRLSSAFSLRGFSFLFWIDKTSGFARWCACGWIGGCERNVYVVRERPGGWAGAIICGSRDELDMRSNFIIFHKSNLFHFFIIY